MERVTAAACGETEREGLRKTIHLASQAIAQYWPMRTFVHHNPLHGFEGLHFDETVKRGQRLTGGRGYLDGDLYRRYVESGRIRLDHLDEALKTRVRDTHLILGDRRVAHGEVLRTCLTHGLCASLDEPLDALMAHDLDEKLVESLVDRLSSILERPNGRKQIETSVRLDQQALGRHMTLSRWCDRVLDTQIVDQVDAQLIKWCEAFLDEGHATWAMPGREKGFYAAWKSLVQYEWSPCGIPESRRKISQLPEEPEDAVLDSLATLAIADASRQDHLALELAALPGWAGFIKWRGSQTDYEWQQAHPVDLVQFTAVRLWYVRELIQQACRDTLGIEGNCHAALDYMQKCPHAYFLRRERVAGRLPALYAEAVDRLIRSGIDGWESLADAYQAEHGPRHERAARQAAARRLLTLTRALDLAPDVLIDTPPKSIRTLLGWMDDFPESEHGPVWLNALEAGYHEQLLEPLCSAASRTRSTLAEDAPRVRPEAQSVFCIDVRSEPFRRHLESIGAIETFGFAGFFGVFIRYQAWGKEHDTEQFPVIVGAKNEVREIPRSYLSHDVSHHTARSKLVKAGHTLLRDLKENAVAPYVMVETLGWFYGIPLFAKTILPVLYQRWATWLQRLIVPPITTRVTVDKLAPEETEEMLAYEEGAVIQMALREQLGIHGSRVTPRFVEALRRRALNGDGVADSSLIEGARRAGLPKQKLAEFLEVLRRHYHIDRQSAQSRRDRITRTGFTLEEQVVTVDSALRMMGLTRNFARLVLFCAHGSTSENNPFESALDCGACGGNEGKPNARVLAAMANRPQVRDQLAKIGIEIPSDTHFLAGQVDTTTDEVKLFDLEELPHTHGDDLSRLLANLKEAGQLTSQERCARLPDAPANLKLDRASGHVRRRSTDWSQIRPEWGLSGNAAFIIGRRELTRTLNLGGRVFLHSYDYREDPTERFLEVLMTAPQVVAQWINMEHYFSATDNEVYGAGSKIYHNVVGRIGIMSGPTSDLRLGLAWQTMMNGDVPYHEPMRLLAVIEAPRARIERLIARHEVLQHYYHNAWVHLVALDPEDGVSYRYLPSGSWKVLEPKGM